MYSVYIDNKLLYSPKMIDKNYLILEPELTLEDNTPGSFGFTIINSHPYYDDIKKLKSIINVYEDDEEIFSGRILNDSMDFYKRKKIKCEGRLAFFIDSILDPYEYSGTVRGLLEFYINAHNAKVDSFKQFKLGNVTVTDGNDYIVRANSDYANTWEEIKKKMIDMMGGHILVRKEKDGYYIDYLESTNRINDQVVRFGHNLLDLSQYIDASEVFTALIPLGVQDEETGMRLNISNVNDGKNYIYDEEAVEMFGWIWKSEIWDDVTIDTNLLSKAKSYLASNIEMAVSLEMKAIDLKLVGTSDKGFRLLDQIRVVSIPHKLDRFFELTKITIKLDNPSNNDYSFGSSYKTLTEQSSQMKQQIASSAGVEAAVISVQQNITTINNNLTETNKVVSKIDGDYTTTEEFNEFKDEVAKKMATVYVAKGSVSTYDDLPKRNNSIGDVYNVYDTGANYVYTSQGWDKLSETIDLSGLVTIEELNEIENEYNQTIDTIIERLSALEQQKEPDENEDSEEIKNQ